MARYKIIYLLLLTYTVYVSPKEAEDRTISLKPPDKLVLQKSSPYTKQEPSFLSKIKNWFFPSSDPVPAEGRHGGPQYLPPQPYQSQPGCHPCNQAPWIPVASNLGHNTLINFVPPSSHNSRPPAGQYGPPPAGQYGPPPAGQYGPPPAAQYGPPSSEYGGPPPPPPSNLYGPPPPRPSNQYGPPPSFHFKPPPQFRPRPDKLIFIQNLKPPPITHLNPISDNYAPVEMKPPPLRGNYQSLPPTSPSGDYYLPPPPPPPSDSYGTPIVGPNADYQTRPEYLPPVEQLPLSSVPIPLPNLSAGPVAPIHGPQEFRHYDNIPQQGANYEVKSNHNIQVIPSVKVADFLASIEHPINVIQSPLVEVSVKEGDVKPSGFYEENLNKLSENPIVVEDTHTAASAVNISFQESTIQDVKIDESSYRSEGHEELNSDLLKQLLLQQETSSENKTFTPPPVDYSRWQPSWNGVSSSMVPPPVGPTTWLQPVTTTTKKPKQIQIIVPYISDKKPEQFKTNVGRMVPSKPYSTLLPVYSPPSTTEEIWSKFVDDFNSAESKKITATAFTAPTTQVYNIRDLLKDTKEYYSSDKLPFDVISLQNNIDDWTQQSYSKVPREDKSSSNFVPAKKIPNEYFDIPETTTVNFDHEQAGSLKEVTKTEDDIESNLIFRETTTTTEPTTTTQKLLWEKVKVTVSPLTKEKVYIVTPQPYKGNSTPRTAWSNPPKVQNLNETFPTPKFLVRVDPEDKNSREKLKESPGPLTVVFSEWPHLINNLQTTTTVKPTSKHPLLGLMDLSKYTPPPNSTVETISGHSRVVTVVTPSAVTEKIQRV